MKVLLSILLSLTISYVMAQNLTDKEIKSEVNEVTVFINKAQVTRQKTIELSQGKTQLKFVNLSPFIDAKSVRVKANGALTVLSVNHQQNYLSKTDKSKELTELESNLATLTTTIEIENTHLLIIGEELSFLQENKNIGGKNQATTLTNLQQTADYYSSKLTALKLKEIERKQKIQLLYQQQSKLQTQINALSSQKNYPNGEVLITVDAVKAGSASFELTYVVSNAGWFPSYDIRASSIDEPVQLIYKANVKQDTKEDWTNVKLALSSSNPNISGVAPVLKTYYLNYNTLPPSYNQTNNTISGTVSDENGTALAGATITVKGSTITTITDMEGQYTITIPQSASSLEYSYIGYNTKTQAISGNVMNVRLGDEEMYLSEVVAVGYGNRKKEDRAMMKSARYEMEEDMASPSLALSVTQNEQQTAFNFEIQKPYSLKSDNKNYTIDIENIKLNAEFQYYCVPKIDQDAFLITHITDWEKYNLMEGEANVFFEDTYVGKTLLDVREAKDTLEISLGRDKKVSVKREKVKDTKSKQFIGSKAEITRGWKTTIKNNKNQAINILVLDQVPVPTDLEIEVNTTNTSGAKQNSQTGELKWLVKLAPNEQKVVEIKYNVKYPKNKYLLVE